MYVAWPHAFFINRRTPNARVSISGRRYNWLLRSRDLLRSIVISTSLCLSVCAQGYLRNHMRDFYYFCARCMWLGPPPASLRYAMYFRFFG